MHLPWGSHLSGCVLKGRGFRAELYGVLWLSLNLSLPLLLLLQMTWMDSWVSSLRTSSVSPAAGAVSRQGIHHELAASLSPDKLSVHPGEKASAVGDNLSPWSDTSPRPLWNAQRWARLWATWLGDLTTLAWASWKSEQGLLPNILVPLAYRPLANKKNGILPPHLNFHKAGPDFLGLCSSIPCQLRSPKELQPQQR